MVLGKMLQILIVRGDDSECTFLIESFQHRFGYSSTYLRLGTSTKLVNKDKATAIASLHHILHISKV